MFTSRHGVALLRYSLAVVFVWFGVLKLFNVSPDLEMLKTSLPAVLGNSQLFLFVFSFLEILIGVGLFLKRTVRFSAIVMILELVVTGLLIIFTQGFEPRFPVLSLTGEFVIKNIVFIAAGLVLLTEKEERAEEISAEEIRSK